jgi:choline dehydrogenase-like flavoprotein
VVGEILTVEDLSENVDLSCDVCIVGSGAGGSVLAAGLVARGLSVILLEAGGHHTNADFDLQEATAFPMLYQDRGTRTTADLGITILQGRSVGGSTTVNWTTCYRTPERILDHWRSHHGVEGLDAEVLKPHFEAVEARLNIHEWPSALINNNNGALKRGCETLGFEHGVIRRNTRGCVNSGYCGFGCPVNGKQAMHVTYIPDAIEGGLRVFANCRADRFETQGNKVVAVHASVMEKDRDRPTGTSVVIRPKVAISSGGAINGPALLLRSGLDDHGRVGKRTFLHPVVVVVGEYEEPINAFYGAPQSVASHQFVDRGADKIGYFIEAAPLHPMMAATAYPGLGGDMAAYMSRLPYFAPFIGLSVDGLMLGDDGGTVSLRPDGRIRLDYPVKPHLIEAMRHAHVTLARLQFAAGAKRASTVHRHPVALNSDADLGKLLTCPYGTLEHTIFSAHQMGGCSMGKDPENSVVNARLRHHRVENLYVVDGSVMPTALGVNPSETIYGLAHWACDHIAAAV